MILAGSARSKKRKALCNYEDRERVVVLGWRATTTMSVMIEHVEASLSNDSGDVWRVRLALTVEHLTRHRWN